VLRHINTQGSIAPKKKRRRGMIILMLLLMLGIFGLFAGLVFFSEGVIAPESTS
jgi:hypothetical protein